MLWKTRTQNHAKKYRDHVAIQQITWKMQHSTHKKKHRKTCISHLNQHIKNYKPYRKNENESKNKHRQNNNTYEKFWKNIRHQIKI